MYGNSEKRVISPHYTYHRLKTEESFSMKKNFAFLICTALVCSMSGCSDFGFNPTGQWQFVSDTLYADGTVADIARAEDNSVLSDMKIIFEKSGTGHLDSVGVKVDDFTYSYDDESITITFLANDYHGEIVAEFKISDDGQTIVRTENSTENNISYTEEYLYKRI